VRFDPAPESIEELQVLLIPGDGSARTLETLEPGGFEWDGGQLRFTMPSAPSSGMLVLSVAPWARVDVECDFAECLDGGLFHAGTPVPCAVPIEVLH